MGKVCVKIKYNSKQTKLPHLITKRTDITPLLGVNRLKQLPITINKIALENKTGQSETTTIHAKFKKLFKTNHSIKNTEVKIRKSKDATQYNKKHSQNRTTYMMT